ncbi:MAG: murein DD-endopeptidase MepM/ murein hydrolase activator NlpD [Neolewinella sp.]|jgi:murein DD-endopeptidase MepM/ murein hydrolase activator NlpD
MKQMFILCLLLVAAFGKAQDQTPSAAFGGEYVFDSGECVSEEQRAAIVANLVASTDRLKSEGIISAPTLRSMTTSLDWPTRQAAGFDYNSYYGISNFVDHDQTFPNSIEDYDCGTRSYDLSSGYNHRGLDIFTWPFGWKMVNDEQVEVIAAAPGTIILKEDGNPDRNCDFSNPNWNAIYIRHTDGSVAWYGHMKNGSLSSKSVGQTVAQGEYLGVVASSGSSTGPHLHFEVWEDDSYTNLIDPYAGSCNSLNSSSWWSTQKPYRESTINHVMTNSDFPVFNNCPNPATINEKTVFIQGETVYFTAYFQDHLLNDFTALRIIRPNGTTWSNWTHTNNGDYDASWWAWSWNFPGTEPLGTWQFEVSFMGQVITTDFIIANSLPVDLAYFEGELRGKTTELTWGTANESNNSYFAVQRSAEGLDFVTLGRVAGSGTANTEITYDFTDSAPLDGINYYRLLQVDYDEQEAVSRIVSVNFIGGGNIGLLLYPNPVESRFVVVQNPEDGAMNSLSIYNTAGALVSGEISLSVGQNRLPLGLRSGVYFLKFTGDAGTELRRLYVK